MELLQILHKIYARKESELFRDPVPHEELGLTDYLDIIKRPMCLNMVRSRLEGKGERYKSMEEAAVDIRLIWRNALLYNLSGSKVYNIALQLSDFWESLYTKLNEADADRPPSVEHMQAFVEKCYRLTQEELGALLNRLDQMCPMCLIKVRLLNLGYCLYVTSILDDQRSEANECEVNVDLMTGSAFREAER